MSIQSEIDRLALAKDDLADAIAAKGVAVPPSATLDSYPALVLQIETGDMLKSVYDPQDRSTDIFAAVDAAAAKYEATLTYSGWSSATYTEQQQGYPYAQEVYLTALTPDAPTTTASSIFLSPCSREPVGVPETDAVLDEVMALINSKGVVSTLSGGRIRVIVQEKPTSDVTLQWLIREPVYQGGGDSGSSVLSGKTQEIAVGGYSTYQVVVSSGIPTGATVVASFCCSASDTTAPGMPVTVRDNGGGSWAFRIQNSSGRDIQGHVNWIAVP